MNLELKKIIPFIISLLALFLLCHFRSMPVSQFWKGYRMLYVYGESLSEQDILTVLEKNGCTSVVSYGKQGLPLASHLSPVQAQDSSSYIYRRADFFMDKNHRAMVFYIPENQDSQLERAIREISSFQGTKAGTDGKSSFPWLAPIISLALFAFFFCFSKKRLLYAAGSFFMLLLSFSRPLFTVAAASSMYLFAFFIFHRVWMRKDFLKTVLNSHYVLLFALSPLLVLLLSSPLNSVFYLFALLGSASFVAIYALLEQSLESRYSFQPVFIRSARMIPVLGRLGIRLLGVLFLSLFITLLSFKFLGNVSSFSNSASMPSLPAPVSHSDGELVQLSDFVNWSWNTVTFPYKKIGEGSDSVPQEGEVVSINDYQQAANGKIVRVSTPAFVFNSDFKDSVYKSIENLDYPALEKMMLRQGKNASFGYAKKAAASNAERFGSLLLLVFITLTAALGINYILGRKRYGLSI